MYKPKVVFPFVEAGFGHIMTEKSVADAFEKKYGDLCEVERIADRIRKNALQRSQKL